MEREIETRPSVPHCEKCGGEIQKKEIYNNTPHGNILTLEFECKECHEKYEVIP